MPNTKSVFSLLLCGLLISIAFVNETKATDINSKLDVSARLDDRSGRDLREQYRVRWYASIDFDSRWSLHTFAVTGDEFSSSYNTFGESHDFNLRRLYMRYQNGRNKTEIGVIPTYKGRISSTGLSKDGWITGVRRVTAVGTSALFEVVVGALDHLNDPNSLQTLDELNYVELEWSQDINEHWSFELGLEHMLEDNFFRTELRHNHSQFGEYIFEVINRLDNGRVKVNLSTEQTFTISDYDIDVFALYSYVNDNFGPRAELTEDFLDTGQAMMLELEGALVKAYDLDWFVKAEAYEEQSRFQVGIKFTL